MQKRTMLSKNAKISKEEWEGTDYSPRATEEDIVRALSREYSGTFDGLVRAEYIGTDWAMGSQYWAVIFKVKNKMEDYACVTLLDWRRYESQRGFGGFDSHGYAYGSLEEMQEVLEDKVRRNSRGTKKSKAKGMQKNAEDYREFASRLGETWDFVSNAFLTLDDMCRSGFCPQRLFPQVDNLAGKLKEIMMSLENVMDEYEYTDLFPKSTKKSKSVRKGADSIAKGDTVSISRKVTEICDLNTAISRYCDRNEGYSKSALDDIDDACDVVIERMNNFLPDDTYEASAKKSKVSKSQISKRFAKSYIKRIMDYSKLSKVEKSKLKKEYNGWENHSTWAFMLHWNNDPYLANLPYELIESGEVESYQELQNRIYDEIDMLIDSIKEELYSLSPIAQDICGFAVEQVNTHQCKDAIMDEAEYHNAMASYSASAKKSKREILKAKVDELLEEDDDEIAKPRMKDMFLDSKRKSRKSTKSNDEKGEDADEYREESDGDDVSDSKVVKPEEANDNEDENEAPSGGNSSLPEDADGQENQSTKRKKRMSKFSVTAGGSQPYNGRQNYNQSPMMREAIDRFKAEKDLVKSLQDRVDEINGARKNTEVNNKSPLRIKGRY